MSLNKDRIETAIAASSDVIAEILAEILDEVKDLHCPESYGFEGFGTFSDCGKCIVCISREVRGES